MSTLEKNGHDQAQDREIHELQAWRAKDEKIHQAILARLDKYLFGGRIVWAGIALFMVASLSVVAWMAMEISSHRASQCGTDRAISGLEREVHGLREDLRDLRTLVQAHQINKQEHREDRGQKDR